MRSPPSFTSSPSISPRSEAEEHTPVSRRGLAPAVRSQRMRRTVSRAMGSAEERSGVMGESYVAGWLERGRPTTYDLLIPRRPSAFDLRPTDTSAAFGLRATTYDLRRTDTSAALGLRASTY